MASVLRSAAVKKIVPILSTRVVNIDKLRESISLSPSHLKFENRTCSVYNG
jgi:hypothetical protein